MRPLALSLLVLCAAPAAAGLFGRSKVVSVRTAAPLPVNADDSDWNASTAHEAEGLALMAMNDDSDLYLVITARTKETREQLTGEARQDLSLWFIKADGKTRDWGAKLPFSRRSSARDALKDHAGVDPEPEYLEWRGAAVSSSTWPSELKNRLGAAGRRPVWMLKVPLSRLAVNAEKAVAVDFSVAAPVSLRPRRRTPDEKAEDVWGYALDWELLVRLAPAPGEKK